MPTRRDLLERGAEGAGLAALAALAGCSSDGGSAANGTDTDTRIAGTTAGTAVGTATESETTTTTAAPSFPGPAYAAALYDPAAVVGTETTAFFSHDVATLLALRDRIPEDGGAALADAVTPLEGVDARDVERLSGVAGVTLAGAADYEELLLSVRATGSFDREAVTAGLADASGVRADGDYGDHGVFVRPAAVGGADAAYAVGDETLHVGAADADGVDARASITLPIDAAAGEAERYVALQSPGDRLVDRFSGTLSVTGIDVSPTLAGYLRIGLDGGDAVARGLSAIGLETTVDGTDAVSSVTMLYRETADLPPSAPLRGLLTEVLSGEETTIDPSAVSVSRGDSAVTLSVTRSLSRVFADPVGGVGVVAPGMVLGTVYGRKLGTAQRP